MLKDALKQNWCKFTRLFFILTLCLTAATVPVLAQRRLSVIDSLKARIRIEDMKITDLEVALKHLETLLQFNTSMGNYYIERVDTMHTRLELWIDKVDHVYDWQADLRIRFWELKYRVDTLYERMRPAIGRDSFWLETQFTRDGFGRNKAQTPGHE